MITYYNQFINQYCYSPPEFSVPITNHISEYQKTSVSKANASPTEVIFTYIKLKIMHYFVSSIILKPCKCIPTSQSDLRNNSTPVSLYFHSFITCSYIETITRFICLNIFSYADSSTSFCEYHRAERSCIDIN